MLLELRRDSHIPLYTQIVTEVRRKITDGALKVGDRLPANRELAKRLASIATPSPRLTLSFERSAADRRHSVSNNRLESDNE